MQANKELHAPTVLPTAKKKKKAPGTHRTSDLVDPTFVLEDVGKSPWV